MDINELPQELREELKASTLKGLNLQIEEFKELSCGDSAFAVVTQGEELPTIKLVSYFEGKEIYSELSPWVMTIKEACLKGSSFGQRNMIKGMEAFKPGFKSSLYEGLRRGGKAANSGLESLFISETRKEKENIILAIAIVVIPFSFMEKDKEDETQEKEVKSVKFHKFSLDPLNLGLLKDLGAINFLPF